MNTIHYTFYLIMRLISVYTVYTEKIQSRGRVGSKIKAIRTKATMSREKYNDDFSLDIYFYSSNDLSFSIYIKKCKFILLTRYIFEVGLILSF